MDYELDPSYTIYGESMTTCLRCGSNDIDFTGDEERWDTTVLFPYNCNNCGFSGAEHWVIDFWQNQPHGKDNDWDGLNISSTGEPYVAPLYRAQVWEIAKKMGRWTTGKNERDVLEAFDKALGDVDKVMEMLAGEMEEEG